MTRIGLLTILILLVALPISADAQVGDLSPEDIIQLVLSLLPHGDEMTIAAVYYNRDFREPLADDELAIGTAVTFLATKPMAIGQVGVTTGRIVGYSFTSPPNVRPTSFTGPFNRAEWPLERYIIVFDKYPGNGAYISEIMLERWQFVVQ